MKQLRLLVTKECDKNCKGCCNNDWDLDALPIIDNYGDFDVIMITGGEPLQFVFEVLEIIRDIKRKSKALIYLYTAKPINLLNIKGVSLLNKLDGLTVTLHDTSDVFDFNRFADFLHSYQRSLSNRLNIFKNVDTSKVNKDGWKVKDKIKWIKNCPLPEGEIIGKYKDFIKKEGK